MRPMILPCDWADDPPRFGLVGLRSIEVHERFVVGVVQVRLQFGVVGLMRVDPLCLWG